MKYGDWFKVVEYANWVCSRHKSLIGRSYKISSGFGIVIGRTLPNGTLYKEFATGVWDNVEDYRRAIDDIVRRALEE